MPASATTVSAAQFVLRLAALDRIIDDALSAAARSATVGRAALAVLCELEVNGPSRPGRLHEITGFTSGGVSRCLDGLVEQGLIKRTYGTMAEDRRGVQVAITPKGRELIRRFSSLVEPQLESSDLAG